MLSDAEVFSRDLDWCLFLLNAVWADVCQSAGVQCTKVGASQEVQLRGVKAVGPTQELCHDQFALKEKKKQQMNLHLKKTISTHICLLIEGKHPLWVLKVFFLTMSGSHSPSSEFISAARVSGEEMFHLLRSVVVATRETDPSSWTCSSGRPDGYAYKKGKNWNNA